MATCAVRRAWLATPRVMLPFCALVFSDGPRSRPRRSQRRSDPKQQRGDRRQNSRECEHPRIDARIHDGSLPRWEPQHEIFPPPGKDGAADPPEYGEEEGFGHQLPNHSPAARAECQTHRYLLAARRRAHQQEGRQIDTSDQQNGGDDGEDGGQDLLCIDAGAIGSLRARAHAELWKLTPCRDLAYRAGAPPNFHAPYPQMSFAARRAPVLA